VEVDGEEGLLPRVTIVIPAYNCAGVLGDCLHSLFAQTYPRDRYDIVVVDDGSTDGTETLARECAGSWGGRVTVVSKANGGPASARNAGIRQATGDIVAFTDADCVAAADWLEGLVRRFAEAPEVAGIGGPLRNVATADHWVSRYLLAVEFYRHRMRNGRVDYLVTANAAFRRSALTAVGGFTERDRAWAEDADLCFRLVQSGYTLLLAPQGSVTHVGVLSSVRRFVRELYRYGFGNSILAREWPVTRQPVVQLIRHTGAIVLSPALAVRMRRRVGLRVALSFCPLIAIEHAAFNAGLISGYVSRLTGKGREE
jgi:cellulose synthase/poly-beta-1,6-N-acetylglucosamine synthase-like glycosyltransferase